MAKIQKVSAKITPVPSHKITGYGGSGNAGPGPNRGGGLKTNPPAGRVNK